MTHTGGLAFGRLQDQVDIQSLGPREIARIVLVAERESGIVVDPEKPDFIVSRLGKRLAALELTRFGDYCDLIEGAAGAGERRHFCEALTTHTTSFFRESAQYDWLTSEGLPALTDAGAGDTRDMVIWSAACSTGQELFTAMMVIDTFSSVSRKNLRYRGIGTDLSRKIVRKAEQAVYTSLDIEGIPLDMRRRYLLTAKNDEHLHRFIPDLRRRCEWRQANLTQRETYGAIDADVIFIRNVLIYFDRAMQAEVLGNVINRLRPGGYLLTGHAETSQARQMGLTTIRPSIYRKD